MQYIYEYFIIQQQTIFNKTDLKNHNFFLKNYLVYYYKLYITLITVMGLQLRSEPSSKPAPNQIPIQIPNPSFLRHLQISVDCFHLTPTKLSLLSVPYSVAPLSSMCETKKFHLPVNLKSKGFSCFPCVYASPTSWIEIEINQD